MKKILSSFLLGSDKDDPKKTIEHITASVPFRGTNLWVLIFAILVASVGLNINSTAVVIGAMLISPLMGPIIGIGLGIAINDFELIKKAFRNFALSAVVSILVSALYFHFSPLSEAYSELLLRTNPAVWDVLIAFFGGLAGIIAFASKEKANVIPGVAIATALMPPLCTAGFGLAHLEMEMFLGASYLFLINSVFISLATYLTVRFLKFPLRQYSNPEREKRVKRLIVLVVIITIAPSFYIATRILNQTKFNNNAEKYISQECAIKDNYLLDHKIDPNTKSIQLVFGGRGLNTDQRENLKFQLNQYELADAQLTIQEGFSLKSMEGPKVDNQKFLITINSQEQEIRSLREKLDSISAREQFTKQLMREARSLYPDLLQLSIGKMLSTTAIEKSDSLSFVYMKFTKIPKEKEQTQIQQWLKTKLNEDSLQLVVDN